MSYMSYMSQNFPTQSPSQDQDSLHVLKVSIDPPTTYLELLENPLLQSSFPHN